MYSFIVSSAASRSIELTIDIIEGDDTEEDPVDEIADRLEPEDATEECLDGLLKVLANESRSLTFVAESEPTSEPLDPLKNLAF